MAITDACACEPTFPLDDLGVFKTGWPEDDDKTPENDDWPVDSEGNPNTL